AERAPGIDVPAPIEGVVQRLLEKDPGKRFETGDEVIAALDGALAAAGLEPLPSSRPLSSRPQSMVEAAEYEAPTRPAPPPSSRGGREVNGAPTADMQAWTPGDGKAPEWRGPPKPVSRKKASVAPIAIVLGALAIGGLAVMKVRPGLF